MFMVITCDNVCELLLMERRVTGKPSCTVRSGGKAGNVRYSRLTYRYKAEIFFSAALMDLDALAFEMPSALAMAVTFIFRA